MYNKTIIFITEYNDSYVKAKPTVIFDVPNIYKYINPNSMHASINA